jgi:hypothetical protein
VESPKREISDQGVGEEFRLRLDSSVNYGKGVGKVWHRIRQLIGPVLSTRCCSELGPMEILVSRKLVNSWFKSQRATYSSQRRNVLLYDVSRVTRLDRTYHLLISLSGLRRLV